MESTVDMPLLEVKDKAPVEVSTPEPVMVALPDVPVDKLIPPLAVTAPLTLMLFEFVVTDNEPAPSLLALSWMAPV